MGRNRSTAQKNDLLDRRRKMEARISTYEQRISYIIKLDENVRWSTQAGKRPDDTAEIGDISDDDTEDYPDGWFTPEKERITLPSALAQGEVERLSIGGISQVEAELRKGQINDALEELRLALGEKSLCFRAEVRNADSQRTSQRAWDNVHKYDSEARKHRGMYTHARGALQRLPDQQEYLQTLHDITENDMKMSGDITEEQRFGQRSDMLAWFWRRGGDVDSGDVSTPRMQECMCWIFYYFYTNSETVYRVSWLRAKARYLRWAEEIRLVRLEMHWTINWFRDRERCWMERLESLVEEEREDGLKCYCHKQIGLWKALGDAAEQRFSGINRSL